MKLGFAFLTACAQIALSQAFYTTKDHVNILTPQNFKSEVLDTNQLAVVEFYAPWCGHCQRLAPEWKKAAANLKGLVSLNAIDCDVDANKPICGQYDIKGFPTIKVFNPELRKNKNTGKMSKTVTDYQGPRDAKAIVDHLLSNQPSDVLFVKWNEKDVKSKKSITLDQFLATKNETMPKTLLFTHKPTTTPLYKSLSIEFKNRMLVGEVKQSEKSIAAEFGIESFPTLLVISPEHGPVKFEGKLNRDSLKSFLEQYALKKEDNSKRSDGEKEPKPKAEPKMKKVEAIESDQAMKSHCLNTGSICVIAITDDENKDDTVNVLSEVSKKRHGYEYGWIHASRSKDITQLLQLPEDYPSLFILHPTKQAYRTFMGAFDQKSVQQWLDRIQSGALDAWPFKGDFKLTPKIQHDEL